MTEGVLHVHSEYSYDAKIPLAELKAAFLKAGLRFACMTEHTDDLSPAAAESFIRKCEALSDDHFTFIPGFEMPYLGTHILLLGVHQYTFNEHDLRGSLEQAVTQGARAIIAHPHRNGFRVDEIMHTYCIGTEVWNSQYDGKRFPRPWALSWFRKLRKKHANFFAFGGIDMHRHAHFGGPRLRLFDHQADERSILAALSSGSYRISRDSLAITPEGHVHGLSGLKLWTVGTLSLALLWIARLASSGAHRFGLRNSGSYRRIHTWLRKRL